MAGKSKIMETVIAIAGEISPTLGKAISGVNKQLGGLNDATIIASAAIAAVGKAAIDAGKKLYELGTEFDAAADSIRIGTGATGDALDDLLDDFDRVYTSVPTTMEDASKAIADYNTRLGLTGPVLQTVSKQAIQVSDMLGDDLNSVIESSSKAFQQWSVDSEDMGDAMDYIFKVSQSTGMGFTTIMDSMQKFGPQLQDMGYSFETASALMGQLEKAGVNTEEVLGAMKKSVGALAKEGIDAGAGLEAYCEYIKNAGTEAEAAAIASEIFGARAGSTMASAIRNGTLAVEDLTASLAGSSETIGGAAGDTYDFSEKLQLLKQKASVALQPLANTIFDSLNKVMPIAEKLMEKLTPVIEDAAESVASFIEGSADKLAGWVESILPKIFNAIEWISNNTGLIKGIAIAIGVVATAIGVLNAVMAVQNAIMMASPVTWIVLGIVAAIAALIAIIVLCVKHWDKIKAAAVSAVDWIVGAWNTVANWMNEKVIQPIVGFFTGLWDSIVGIFQSVIDWVKTNWESILLFIINPFAGVFNYLYENFEGFRAFVDTFIQKIKDGFANMVNGIKEFFVTGFESLVSIIKKPVNAIVNIVNGAIDGINDIGFDIPDWVPIIGGQKFSLDIPKLPTFATGGFTDGVSIAGEAGTEAIISFDSRYREQNLSYWAQAGRMLGASASDFNLGGSSSSSVNFGGITFAPKITVTGRADKDSIMAAIEEEYPEFMDMLDEYFMSRGVTVYG